MCNQSNSISTSFMCGTDLDNYLRNPYYRGPFTNGTRLLNKYRESNTNPFIDHIENIELEGCAKAINTWANKKPPPNFRKNAQQESSCGCNNKKSLACPPPPPQPCCCSQKEPQLNSPPKRPPCCFVTNNSSDSSLPPQPPCCHPKPEPKPVAKDCDNNNDNDIHALQCKELHLRGKVLLQQIERTLLPCIEIEDDEYLPSITGGGWQIPLKEKVRCKSKFQQRKYDPYYLLHAWEKNLRGGDDKSEKTEKIEEVQSKSTDGDSATDEQEINDS